MDLREIRRKVAEEIALFERVIPTVTADIGVVWVLSGSGTYLKPYLPGDPPHHLWSDQRRISKGFLMVLQVTALRLGKSLQEIERSDVHIQGPMLVYNGTPTHNADLMAVLDLPNGLIPKSKVFIIEEVKDRSGESRLIRNTLDQILSFPTDQIGYQLSGAVAIVSSAPHLPRILRYLGKYRPIPDAVPIRCFPVLPDPEWSKQFAEEEINRVCEYLQQGYLTAAPYPKNLGIG